MLLRNERILQIDKAAKNDAPKIIEYLNTVGGERIICCLVQMTFICQWKQKKSL